MSPNARACMLTLAALCVTFGCFLDHSFALHVVLGNAFMPHEAIEEVSLLAIAATAVFLASSYVAAGLAFSNRRATSTVSGVVAVSGMISLYAMDKDMVSRMEAAYVAVAISIVSRFTSTKGQPRSLAFLGAFVALLAFVLAASKPESSCGINPSAKLKTAVEESFTLSHGFEVSLSSNRGLEIFSLKGARVFSSEAAFLVAAKRGHLDAHNEHEMGLYHFIDTTNTFSTTQQVESFSKLSESSAELKGLLVFENEQEDSIPWSFVVSVSDEERLDFSASVEGASKTFLIQDSFKSEGVYGMGQQFSFFNLKGGCVPVWTMEQGIGRGIQPITFIVNFFVNHASGHSQTAYAPSPFFMTSEFRALYLTNSQHSLFDFSSDFQTSIAVNATRISGTLISADSPKRVVELYTKHRAGRMKPLPDWIGNGAVLGLQGGTDVVRRHVAKLKSKNVPISALWLQDWTGKRETDFGRRLQWNWEVSSKHYPGWGDFVEEMLEDGIKVMTYVNTYLANTGGNSNESITLYKKAVDMNCLIKESDGVTNQIQISATPDFTFGTVDLSNPRCRKWYVDEVLGKSVLAATTSAGKKVPIYGCMSDFSEGISTGVKMHGGEGHSLHNDFPVMWASTMREAVEKFNPDAVFFTRAGGADTPKYTTLQWEGDQMTTFDVWDGLRSTIAAKLSGGLSGYALSHSDVGGYTMFERFGGLIKFVRSPELLMRWAEMSAFSDAVFRTHEGVLPDASSQASDDDVVEHFAKFAKLHAFLFKRVKKALMKEAFDTGVPITRHLMLEFPSDPNVYKSRDQFLLGSEIIVCPILRAGGLKRKCYVPEGTWHTWDHAVLKSRSYFDCDAPIGKPCALFKSPTFRDEIAAILFD